VTAEGVETEAQIAFLLAERCDEAQGYFLARPVPAAEFERLLRDPVSLAARLAPLRSPEKRSSRKSGLRVRP
jgi:predicted signal transduction protein with EAL and GGDEF domain